MRTARRLSNWGPPPHARGPHPGHLVLGELPGTTPARAGTTGRGCHVRSRTGPPPHARGPQEEGRQPLRDGGTTPARAGTTSRPACRGRRTRDHPRTRGDHDYAMATGQPVRGPPPHARGPLLLRDRDLHYWGTTPARAGTTEATPSRSASSRDHPRTRGDHWAWVVSAGGLPGPPPHARGPQSVTCSFMSPRGCFYLLPGKRTYLPCCRWSRVNTANGLLTRLHAHSAISSPPKGRSWVPL